MKNIMIISLLMLLLTNGCEVYKSPDPDDFREDSTDVKKLYIEQYDPIRDEGQYWLPLQKRAKDYWVVVNATSNDNTFDDNSLRNTILAESIIGLTALAVNEGNSSTLVWTDADNSSYTEILKRLGLKENGRQTTWELLEYHENVKSHIKGYVLCKTRNQESLTVATIASHVYQSVIIEQAYEDRIKELGYELKYDARYKTLADAWSEFKDKCNNNALVLMPTLTGNLKSFAIANRLMAVNYYKSFGSTARGDNKELFEEVLDWLKPLSPVLGWESAIEGENVFVDPVSRSGNMMVPSDWIWNIPMMSQDYKNNQPGLVSVTNPQFINYSDSVNYASFFLTDGDNVQWMMNDFLNNTYFLNNENYDLQMSFGLPVANLSMISPIQLDRIISSQVPNNTLIEFGGGGYYYPDNFGINKNRTELLDEISKKVAAHMRQHRVKVLGLICQDVNSEEAKEAYRAYIQNNNQLIGIIAIQYDPYSAGNGEIMWFTNSDGIDIPVITAKYAIWNYGTVNMENQGTPTYIATKINELAENDDMSFSLVAVHAWSKFKDIGDSMDPIEENIDGTESGPLPASWCKRKINAKTKVVNVEELIWQLRMHERPEQTTEFLSTYY
ncbi:MAG: hypothetical protein GXO47_10815 [Chlorobi bacterium]|nr:hypothetical protein [Chlorobiota bacterium]